MNVLKWVLAICLFHSLMLFAIIMILFMPFMMYDDFKDVLIYEVPVDGGNFLVISMLAFIVYLATKSEFLGFPYRKITILLPLLHMFIFTSLALSVGVEILNKWADNGLFSKGWAIALAVLAIGIIRLGMSLLYWKYPIIQRRNQ